MSIRFGSGVCSKFWLQSDRYSFSAGTHFDKEIEWAYGQKDGNPFVYLSRFNFCCLEKVHEDKN